MTRRLGQRESALLLILLLNGCVARQAVVTSSEMQGGRVSSRSPSSAGSLAGESSRLPSDSSTSLWTRDELFFGMNMPAGGIVTDSAWQAFVESEVAPRLPDGFTILHGTGYYRNSTTGRTQRESSRVLLVLYRDDQPEIPGRLNELVIAYKLLFSQQSVLRVTSRVRAVF